MAIIQALPLLQWLKDYDRTTFSKDFIAGIIITVVLVPQSMAYALLAGVPAKYGLYCAIIPTLLYSLLGSSRHISVAPAALISLMVASSVGGLQPDTSEQYLYYTTVTSFLAGLFLIIMRLLHFGHITRFISIPVISGFTSASAIIIACSQIKYLIGADIPAGSSFIETILHLLNALPNTNLIALLIGCICCLALWFFKKPWDQLIKSFGLRAWLEMVISKSGPLLVVFIAALVVGLLQLDQNQNIAIVGTIPKGFPELQWPPFDIVIFKQLLLPSFFIALMCFLTSIAAGNNLAAKRKERLQPNQELLALGVANLGAAFCSTFPLAASLSRSAVSYNAGSETSIASMISAIGVLLTLFWLTPLFYFLPLVTLGAIVIMSVVSMIEIKQIFYYWKINHSDAISLSITFFVVLIFGIEVGIGVGIVCSILLVLKSMSSPHIAIVGRVDNTEHFRNIKRHKVSTNDEVLILRIDESLYFANVDYVESYILNALEQKKNPKHVILIFCSVSFIDCSAIDMLDSLIRKLRQNNITLNLAEVKGPVMDQIENTELVNTISPGKIFLTTDQAVRNLSWS